MPIESSNSAVIIENEPSVASQCVVRAATATDISLITAIYTGFVKTSTATSEISSPTEAEMLRRWSAAVDRNLPYLVAELEGYIVGFAYVSQFRPREGYCHTVEDSIYVRPDCIGHGVGRLLLSELISQCRDRGVHSMVACIVGENPSSAALHASFGFQKAGSLSEAVCKFGEWLPMLIMQRPLLEKRGQAERYNG